MKDFLTRMRSMSAAASIAAVCAAAPVVASAQTLTSPFVASSANATDRDIESFRASVPVVAGWFDGQLSLYLSTDSSNRDVARMTHTNFVPKLAGAIAGGAVDDIYQLTNFHQGNILPSSPHPAGPENTDPNYTPLWQLSLVTWRPGSKPYTLKSEAAVRAEKAAGHVTVLKTNVVINCPVIFTPGGGVLYGVRILRDR